MPRVLIIDNSPAFCDRLGAIVTGLGHRVDCTTTIAEGLNKARSTNIDVVFINTQLCDGSGLEALPKLRNTRSTPEAIIVADASDPDNAERAIRQGAWDYIEKTGAVDSMVLPLIRALDYRGKRTARSRHGSTKKLNRNNIVGNGAGLSRCLNIVSEAAASDASALLYGETGAGKEVFARCIHENSDRSNGPFVAVDCASLTRTLAGSILFGHRKGAFTGADKDKDGLVLQAHKGTLFLDEVGELPLPMQKIFLRVLQEHKFRPVGGRHEQNSDFRLICATNRNLEEMVARGTFRSDLLFRMRTVVMSIPPLRERTEDIDDLTKHYVNRLCGKYGMPQKNISPDMLDTLSRHQWPGNVRELVHTLERAVLSAQDDPMLFSRHLPDHIRISIARANSALLQETEEAGQLNIPSTPPHSSPQHKKAGPTVTADDAHSPHTPPLRIGAACPFLEAGTEATCPHVTPYFNQTSQQNNSGENSGASPSASNHLTFRSHFHRGGTPQARPSRYAPQGTKLPSNIPAPHAATARHGTSNKQLSISAKNVNAPRLLPTLAQAIQNAKNSEEKLPEFFEMRDTLFKQYLIALLAQSDGNISRACKQAGLSRSYLYDLLKKYQVLTKR